MTDVSAVVVNYNGGRSIIRCLKELRHLEPALQEIVVVDNGSNDGSTEAIRAKFPEVDLVETGENLGPAIARNIGLERVSSPLVLFVDDDVYLSQACLGLLLDCQQRERAAVVAPRLVLVPENVIQADSADVHFTGTMLLRHGRARLDDVSTAPGIIGAFSTSCVLADRSCLLDAGGFDERFFIYQEDMELGLRLRSFGQRLYCEPRAVAHHERGSGTPGLSFRDSGAYPRRRGYLTMRNRLRTVLLHYRLRTLILLAPALAVYELASMVFALRKGWFSAWLQAWWWQIGHLPAVIRRRRWIQRRRLLEDVDLLVGGPLPLAPGVLQSKFEVRIVAGLSRFFNTYWRTCRPLLAGGSAPHAGGDRGDRPVHKVHGGGSDSADQTHDLKG